MDIRSLLALMAQQNNFRRIGTNPLAQFGTPSRQYLGSTLLPERLVNENAFREESVKYRSVLANAGTRYSPTQKKKGVLVGSVDVILAESDIASELTSRDYDALLSVLGQNASMQAVAQMTRFLDTTINIPLVELLEVWKWQAIVDSVVTARGDNDYSEDFTYPNPAGHRFARTADWNLDATDIWEQVNDAAQILVNKGFTVNRMITSRRVVGIMSKNATMQARAGNITVSATGQIQAQYGRANLAQINGAFNSDGLPGIETYDLVYRTSTGSGRFLKDNVFVLVGTTGRNEDVDLGDSNIEVVENTLGYTAIGRGAGQSAPGRVIRSEAFEDKPPRIQNEGWQTAAPVILEPEAIVVITGI